MKITTSTKNLILSLFIAGMISCNKDDEVNTQPIPPNITTGDASEIEGEIMLLSASYESNGNDIQRFGFEYNLSEDFEEINSIVSVTDVEIESFEYQITTGLQKTTYFYRAFIETDSIIYGTIRNFEFSGYTPAISNITPDTGEVNDTVQITGKNFFDPELETLVEFSGLNATTVSSTIIDLNDSIINVIVPTNLELINNSVTVKVGNKQSQPNQFTIDDPVIMDISSTDGTDGYPLQITGKNFGFSPDSVQIFIGDHQLQINQFSNESIYGIIPDNIPAGNYELSILSYRRKHTYSEGFEIKSPEITSYTPASGFDNTLIEIKGNFFSTNSKVLINDLLIDPVESNDSLLAVYSPETDFSGNTTIQVEVGSKLSNSEPFEILSHSVNSITPSEFSVGSIVTINGSLLEVNDYTPLVFFDDTEATILSSSENELRVIVPYIESSFSSMKVSLGKKNKDYQNFQMVDSWQQSEFTPPYQLSFKAKNIQSENEVYYGLGRTSEFTAGDFDGTFLKYNIQNNNWTTLSELTDSEVIGTNGAFDFTFPLGDYLYTIMYDREVNENKLFRYDIANNSWERLNNIEIESLYWAFAYKGELYVGNSKYFNNSIYKYDPVSDSWTYLYDLTVNAPVYHFIVQDRLFIHPQQISNSASPLYELIPETGELIPKASTTVDPYPTINRYTYSLEDRAILIHGHNEGNRYLQVWEYRPDIDQWIRRQNFPGYLRRHVLTFENNNQIFFGLGKDVINSVTTTDFWKFVP